VLQRFARSAALNGSQDRCGIRLAHLGGGDRLRLHLAAAQPQYVPDQQLGVDLGRLDARGR
jgi:hypothetical protein